MIKELVKSMAERNAARHVAESAKPVTVKCKNCEVKADGVKIFDTIKAPDDWGMRGKRLDSGGIDVCYYCPECCKKVRNGELKVV